MKDSHMVAIVGTITVIVAVAVLWYVVFDEDEGYRDHDHPDPEINDGLVTSKDFAFQNDESSSWAEGTIFVRVSDDRLVADVVARIHVIPDEGIGMIPDNLVAFITPAEPFPILDVYSDFEGDLDGYSVFVGSDYDHVRFINYGEKPIDDMCLIHLESSEPTIEDGSFDFTVLLDDTTYTLTVDVHVDGTQA